MAGRPNAPSKATGRIVGAPPRATARRRRKRDERLRPTQRAVSPAGGGASSSPRPRRRLITAAALAHPAELVLARRRRVFAVTTEGSPMSEAQLVSRVRADGLLERGRPIVVMYSGGRDSTCLLDVAVRIAGAEVVGAVHANYGLRAAADADERHCADLCEGLGVQLDVRRPVRPEGATSTADGRRAGTCQAWARDQRYGAAAELALARNADVAAGHTRSDQVETILYRLASSPSRRALLGMRPRGRADPPAAGVHARGDGELLPRARAAVARRREQRVRRPTRATGSGTSSSRRSSARTRPRRPTCWRWPRSCATRLRCSMRLVVFDPRWARSDLAGAAPRVGARAAQAGRATPRRRCRGRAGGRRGPACRRDRGTIRARDRVTGSAARRPGHGA